MIFNIKLFEVIIGSQIVTGMRVTYSLKKDNRMFKNVKCQIDIFIEILQILLHDQGEISQMKDLGFAVAPGTHTLVGIKQYKVMFYLF